MIHHVVSVVGFVIFGGVAWLLSTDRRRIAWKTIAWGVALQVLIGVIIFFISWDAESGGRLG